MKRKNKKYILLCNLYVKSSLKNTLIILTRKNGEKLKQWSTKALKKNKFKKNTSYNIYLLSLQIKKYINIKKIKKINIFLSGNGIGRTNIIKNFNKENINIFYFFNKTIIPFNGCKKKKKKRR
jgi:small subunit ribosomal protein S11